MASALWKVGHSKPKPCNGKPILPTWLRTPGRGQMSLAMDWDILSDAAGGGMKSEGSTSHSSCRRGCIPGFQKHRRFQLSVCLGSCDVCTISEQRMDTFPAPLISLHPFTSPLAPLYPFQWEMGRKNDSNTINFRHWSKSTLPWMGI